MKNEDKQIEFDKVKTFFSIEDERLLNYIYTKHNNLFDTLENKSLIIKREEGISEYKTIGMYLAVANELLIEENIEIASNYFNFNDYGIDETDGCEIYATDELVVVISR